MKRFLWIVAVLSLLTACHRNKGNADAYGNFEATEIIVSSENNGRLLEFSVEEGQTYQAGEVVGCIDTLQLCLQLKQLEASIKAVMARRPDSKSQIQVLKKQLETLEKERARVENLVQANAATAKQLDDIVAQINITKSQMAATESTLSIQSQSLSEEVEALRFQKMQLEASIATCRIKAPITGTVLKKYIEPNELAFQGKPLFKIADLTNMFIKVYVSEDMLSSLRLNQEVTINLDTSGDIAKQAKKNKRKNKRKDNEPTKQFTGKICWISPKAEFTPKMIQTKNERVNLVYAVKVSFINDGSAKIGMPGDVIFK